MSEYDRIRVLYPDQFGLPRGKYIPTARANGEVKYSVTIFAVGYDKDMTPAPGTAMLEGMGDMTATYDHAAVRPSWEPNTGLVVADISRNGEPVPMSPRHALRRAVTSLESLGYTPKVGLEMEAYVMQPDGNGGWEPWDTPGAYCYGTGRTVDPVGVMDDILRTAESVGIPVETAASEYDAPQFEMAIEYSDALDAVDNAFLFKLMAREVAMSHDLGLTFLGRPFGDRGGNGLHVNLSLEDESGANVLFDADAADGLTAMTKHAVAGLLAHHEGMAAFCAPTVNAYKRLVPGQLSGYFANWGYDHRSVAVRIPADRGSGTRIEHRLADGSANPYLAAAAMLQAARLGIEAGEEPPEAETGDSLETANTERCVPENLSLALDALEADDDLVEALGADLVAYFVAMKRAEWGRFATAVTDWELREYLPFH